MQVLKLSFWSLILMVGLLSSCSDDLDTDVISENFANGNNNRGQGNNGPNDDDDDDDAEFDMDTESLDASIPTAWTDLFLEIDRYAEGMRPTATARALAYIHLAAYETAAPAMRDYDSAERIVRGLNISTNDFSRDVDVELALNKAYATVMDHFMLNLPANSRAMIGELETTMQANLSEGLLELDIEESLAWGQQVAEEIIEFSQSDLAAEEQILEPQPRSYEPPVGDGFWTYSADPERALFPYWEEVRTFVISSRETSSVDPLMYSENPNSEYFQQMQEVYDANNSAKENQGEQYWIAEFWSDDVTNIVFSPPARQFSIANQLIEQEDLDFGEALYLNLKLGFSLNDAAVSAWADKYEHMVMRPNVFIHEFIDPSFQTNLFRIVPWPNPTFPGYPSGHSTFASAAGGVFIDFFGDDLTFTDRSHVGRTEFESAPRTYTTISDMAYENAYSRIPLGVHVRIDCDEGLRLGYEIADAVNDVNLTNRNGRGNIAGR